MKKKALRFLPDGSYVDICEYKNCRNDVAKGYIVCEKHIGQTQRDFDRNHFRVGNTIFKCDPETARVMNK